MISAPATDFLRLLSVFMIIIAEIYLWKTLKKRGLQESVIIPAMFYLLHIFIYYVIYLVDIYILGNALFSSATYINLGSVVRFHSTGTWMWVAYRLYKNHFLWLGRPNG
jgi:hypothetical protein